VTLKTDIRSGKALSLLKVDEIKLHVYEET